MRALPTELFERPYHGPMTPGDRLFAAVLAIAVIAPWAALAWRWLA